MRTFICILVVLAHAVISCGVSKKNLGGEQKWIPPDFDRDNTVLLIETYPSTKKYQSEMTSFIEKNYTGRYYITTRDSIMNRNGIYSDTKLYRYALLWTYTAVDSRSAGSSFVYRNTNIDCNFYDRQNGQSYPNTGRTYLYAAGSYRPVIRSINKWIKGM